MAAQPAYPGPPEALERYGQIVAAHPDAARKGAKNPYTSRNGWMTSFLDAAGEMSLRLSGEDRREFLDTYDTRISHQYGRNMPEFAVVPAQVFDDDAINEWFARSWDWVGTLKPKPTKK